MVVYGSVCTEQPIKSSVKILRKDYNGFSNPLVISRNQQNTVDVIPKK